MVRCHLLPRLRPGGKSKPAADYVIQKCEMHPGTWNLPSDATTPLANIAQVNDTGLPAVGAVSKTPTGE